MNDVILYQVPHLVVFWKFFADYAYMLGRIEEGGCAIIKQIHIISTHYISKFIITYLQFRIYRVEDGVLPRATSSNEISLHRWRDDEVALEAVFTPIIHLSTH